MVIPVPEVIFYYGSDPPARRAARALRGVTVVLQPGHPLCGAGAFADYFPHARRFVYWNPTGVTPSVLADAGGAVATLSHDATWDLHRLDLRKSATRRFAVAYGRRALGVPGAHGVFVDDLDLWGAHPSDRRHARAVLRGLLGRGAAPGAGARLFLNRGFGFWTRLGGLEAVLLEDLTPYAIDRMGPQDTAWVDRVVLPALRRSAAAGVSAHCLTYEPTALGWEPSSPTASAFAELVSAPTLGRIHFDRWPDALTQGE